MQIQPEHVDRIARVLDKIEADFVERDEAFSQTAKAKELLVRGLIFLTVLVALINIYFVNNLREEVSAMTTAMVEMNSHFGSVSVRMDNLTITVHDLGKRVRMLPIVADQMNEIADLVQNLDGDVHQIEGVISTTGQRIGAMGLDMQDMSMRFRKLNDIVAGMGRDVDHMARPVP